MQSKADLVRLLWRLLVASVVVYVVAGIILPFSDDVGAFSSVSGFWSFLNDASGVAFRVGAGSLALLAGLALSSRSYDEG
jgi:hypothetical protein